jgi:hypothetical protein
MKELFYALLPEQMVDALAVGIVGGVTLNESREAAWRISYVSTFYCQNPEAALLALLAVDASQLEASGFGDTREHGWEGEGCHWYALTIPPTALRLLGIIPAFGYEGEEVTVDRGVWGEIEGML